MMSRILVEFRRHSLKRDRKKGDPPATVTPEGIVFAKRVGAAQLGPVPYDVYGVSPLERTQETLSAFADGAGWTGVEERTVVPPIYLAWPELKGLWRACRLAEIAGEDMMRAALAYDAVFARRTSEALSALFCDWVRSLDASGVSRAFVVGHSPQIEMLTLGLTSGTPPNFPGVVLPQLKECQGIRVHASVRGDDVSTIVEHVSDDLNPAEIREALLGK